MSEDDFYITRAALDLEQAFEDSESHGSKVKAILITSPSNPLGKTQSQEQLLMILDFVREKDIHLISDEIYAGSVFGTSEFTSIAELVLAPLFNPSHVHIIYGLSKVLGTPGFRVGFLYSWNNRVLDVPKSSLVSLLFQLSLSRYINFFGSISPRTGKDLKEDGAL